MTYSKSLLTYSQGRSGFRFEVGADGPRRRERRQEAVLGPGERRLAEGLHGARDDHAAPLRLCQRRLELRIELADVVAHIEDELGLEKFLELVADKVAHHRQDHPFGGDVVVYVHDVDGVRMGIELWRAAQKA